MTNHVPTLETCQRLKDAGYPQSTYHYWFFGTDGQKWYVVWNPTPVEGVATSQASDRVCAAPVLTELLEKLPCCAEYKNDHGRTCEDYVSVTKHDEGFDVGWDNGVWVNDKTNPSEAAALLWLKLKEEDAA